MEGFRLRIKGKALKSLRQYPQCRGKFAEIFQTLKRNLVPFRVYNTVKLSD